MRTYHLHCDSVTKRNDMYALSLYLKSDNIGLHDNSIELLPIEKFYLGDSSL